MIKTETDNTLIDELFQVGAHFGFARGRRHPSTDPFIFGSKNKLDIFDLEKTSKSLKDALAFISELAEKNETILFVGGKNEARETLKNTAIELDMPYVADRWIGGTLTNFSEIRKRVDTMLDLMSQKEKGELVKYTKKERLLIDRDITKLEKMFWGIKDMTKMPKALFIIDPRFEEIAMKEAGRMGIKIVALCGSDNNIKEIDFPILGNDSAKKSIEYFCNKIKQTYKTGKK
jgi:small subunit ribosomal protein S2